MGSVKMLNRRDFLVSAAAAVTVRAVPSVAARSKRILTLVYDKAAGGMRAVERIVPR